MLGSEMSEDLEQECAEGMTEEVLDKGADVFGNLAETDNDTTPFLSGVGEADAPSAASTAGAPSIAVSSDGTRVFVCTGQGKDNSVAVYAMNSPSHFLGQGGKGSLKFVDIVHDPRSQIATQAKESAAEIEADRLLDAIESTSVHAHPFQIFQSR